MSKITITSVLLLSCLVIDARFQIEEIPGYERSATGIKLIDVTLNDRTACRNGEPSGEQPASRRDTTEQVDRLIIEMELMGFDAYIIPSADAHQSEYPPAADQRRAYISGMTGSAGTVVVLADGRRALWTDSRYHLQADDQMDCTWILMKSGLSGVPSISEWIIESLPSRGSMVSADARLIDTNSWLNFDSDFNAAGLEFSIETLKGPYNIVDILWNNDGRPVYSLDPVFIHELQYAGVSWQDKVNDILVEMSSNEVEVLVLSTLDDTAWFLNLRGTDIAYNPFFRSYIIIDITGSGDPSVILYVPNNEIKLPESVRKHLRIGECIRGDPCVSLGIYGSIEDDVSAIADIANKVWLTSGLSYNIYKQVPQEKLLYNTSPVMLMKAMKNDVEREGMRNAHIRDAIAVIQLLSVMENDITNGVFWRELEASKEVERYRLTLENSMGSSFEAISAFGPNGAIVHYAPTEENNHEITDQSIYLLDSGGQYLDGTTDITRTVHFGEPTDYQIETYTLVMQGMIDYALAVFPAGSLKSSIDFVARQPLLRVGLNFGHGVSHGIGAFGGVHESGDSRFENGYHQSDEPGYYEDGQFGIRIENVVAVIESKTKYDFVPESYEFETLTLVPYEPKLLNLTLLTKTQCNWLNEYYIRIRDIVGPELHNLRYEVGHAWMLSKTEPHNCS